MQVMQKQMESDRKKQSCRFPGNQTEEKAKQSRQSILIEARREMSVRTE